ncbi:lactosylceramide 4-alpha-galactosyltransferase-like isoform X2 [Heterodontus francisci]|uniref:lactosylceramide 4-alpha-galactosyltransferase-like isoform X2 n=1 Tax=Heterodontus francisci TaxID=7792 RepID=UPI00355C9127
MQQSVETFEVKSQPRAMRKHQKVCLVVLTFLAVGIYIACYIPVHCYLQTCYSKDDFPSDFENLSLPKTPAIMFLETTTNMQPSALAVCSVESASRRNPDKPVYYFLKGFSGNLSHYPLSRHEAIRVLSSLKNVIISPLRPRALFQDTPLSSWYEQVNPYWEKYWVHVLADACRISLLWKVGGIYLDTDIISLKPLAFQNFLGAEGYETANNAALGFEKHHKFIWECMEDYTRNYKGSVWGYQGPALMSRVLKRWCHSNNLGQFFNSECKGISYLPPKYFYPISYSSWESYFQPWTKSNIELFFSESKGAHLWNFKSYGQQNQVIAGSGTLLEYFFSKYCPTTYKSLLKSAS